MSLPDWSDANFQAAIPVLDEWIDVYAIPPELAYGLVAWESKFNPAAFLMDRNGGSIGLTQISLPTAQSLGYQGTAAGLYDPDTNVQYGLLYLRNQLDRYGGDFSQALSAYNAGRAITGNLQSYVANVLQRVQYFAATLYPSDDPGYTAQDLPPTDPGSSSEGGVGGPVALALVVALGAYLAWKAFA